MENWGSGLPIQSCILKNQPPCDCKSVSGCNQKSKTPKLKSNREPSNQSTSHIKEFFVVPNIKELEHV